MKRLILELNIKDVLSIHLIALSVFRGLPAGTFIMKDSSSKIPPSILPKLKHKDLIWAGKVQSRAMYAGADTGFRKRGGASNSGRKTAGGIQGAL